MTTIATPIVNINGADRESLKQQVLAAHDAVDEAIDKLLAMMPHGRDYQLNPDDYARARSQHYDRIRALEAVKEELALYALPILLPETRGIPHERRLISVDTA